MRIHLQLISSYISKTPTYFTLLLLRPFISIVLLHISAIVLMSLLTMNCNLETIITSRVRAFCIKIG